MFAIALDGPAGAGKSTLARRVADALGFVYVDTGALYRTIALYVLQEHIDLSNAEDLAGRLSGIHVTLRYENGVQHVFLNGTDVSAKIRTPEVSMEASAVSAVPAVRAHLLSLQRTIAAENNVLMDGRDIGTVVLPDADLKLFVTASPECRAERRYKELLAAGKTVTYDAVLEDMVQRDYNDSHRAIAPLRQAEDAILYDSTHVGLEESVQEVLNIVHRHLAL